MNDLVPINTSSPICANEALANFLSHLDSKTLLTFGGMACLTTIICVGVVSLSGSEMTVSRNGFSITQPSAIS